MKRVISISLGSSKRDHQVELEVLGENFLIERRGTDGDMAKAVDMIKELDGKVAAFGLGGTDLYLYAGNKRYIIREAAKIARAAKKTPIVDGSGLKNTLERKVITYLQQQLGMVFENTKVLMVCGVDRFGMAEALSKYGAKLTCGDLIFAIGLPVPIRSLKNLQRVARIIAPIACQLPFKYLYPTGNKQESFKPRHSKYYLEADVIAGDFHFIKRYMPERLDGKVIITNTVTNNDVSLLKDRGVKQLITTTPELKGRSFGTNVMEALLVALAKKNPEEMTPAEYESLLDQMEFKPRVQML
ncbi:quinate 5-dehydrogenase [Bacillota bacterium LX-D]|nr:quinate 5-dehydrogenase [Bacillota bacterium LX-D]